jgi:hypothetical protein
MTYTLIDGLEIIQATNDGDDLDPAHLKLVELAVNGQLNEAGKTAFAELLTNVRSGYVKPFLHGAEHITRDHDGTIYWKGKHRIEHFSSAYVHTDAAKDYVRQLAEACTALEAKGITPTFAAIQALAADKTT